jgi:protein ImuB
MPRRDAEGTCPDAVILLRDPGEEARRFDPVVSVLESVVPRVEISEPGLAFIPIDGATRFYGTESAVVDAMSGKLAAHQVDVRIGVAEGPFAAYWAARSAGDSGQMIVDDTAEFLRALDISVIDHEDLVSTFRWLGVTTLGELARLPRDAIASRFGEVGLSAHRLASGQDRAVSPRAIPSEPAVESRFEEPLESIDQVAFAARALAARLTAGLREVGIASHRIEVLVETESGDTRSRVWRSADPFTEETLADRVWWQLRAWIEGGGDRPVSGIVRLRLDPSDLSGEGRQLGFFTDETARIEAERALARAQALVGQDAVVQAGVQGGRLPREQVMWRRWGEEATPERDPSAPWPGATPSPAPALVPDDPPRLDVEWDDGTPARIRLGTRWEPVISWAGPWRLTRLWWRGDHPADRYQLVTSAGAFLCLVIDGDCRLEGIYD